MSSISAGTSTGTALVQTGDTTGQLVLKTNGATTAITIGTDQVVTLAQPLPVASGGTGGSATPTAGGIVYGTGSVQAVTAAGTSGQVLQSTGASAPTWQDAAVSTLILVDEVNASASSTVELVGMDSTYKSYMIVASNLVMSAQNNISFTIQQGGSYLTTGYYGNRAGRYSGSTTQTNAQIENAANFLFVNNSPEVNNFTMDIFDPAAASQQTQWIVFHTGWTSGTSYQTFSNGAQSSAGATTAIKFTPSGGTITSGNFKLYGLGG